jgi:hypothetical protein
MTTLGSIIARLADETCVEEALAGLVDLALLARLRSAADAAQEPLGSFACAIVGRFVQHASDDKWLALMTAASRADDPAAAALHRILMDALQIGRAAVSHRHNPQDGDGCGNDR